MKLKMTINQLEALELYLRMSLTHTATNMTLELVRELTIKLYDRVDAKLKKVHRRSSEGTGMTINKPEALALYLWYTNICECLKQDYTYEDIVLNQICLSIHQEYN